MNPTTDICLPLGLPLDEEYPGTILRRSERLAAKAGARWGDDGAEPPDYSLDLQTRESFTASILDLPPRPCAYSERQGMGVAIQYRNITARCRQHTLQVSSHSVPSFVTGWQWRKLWGTRRDCPLQSLEWGDSCDDCSLQSASFGGTVLGVAL